MDRRSRGYENRQVILVDSSVWIDYFRGRSTEQVETLDFLLGRQDLAVGDVVLTEVLQGFTSDEAFERALLLLTSFAVVLVSDEDIAIQAARNFRILRARGVTIRKTIDTLIATRCIEDGHRLLYSDRDFDPFVEHLGLKSAAHGKH